jgi:amino acid transporter
MVSGTFDIFKIHVGPSSSHTMGPMTAAADFVKRLSVETVRIEVLLYGSLALTGRGHATDRAILLGLAGQIPSTIDPDYADALVKEVRSSEIAALANADTLCAFIAVGAALLVLRICEPGLLRSFRTPLAPLVSAIAILGCLYLFWNLPSVTQCRFFAWSTVGLLLYLVYALGRLRRHEPKAGG